MYPKATLSPRARKAPLPGAAGGAADANVAAPAMTMASAAARDLTASCDNGNPRIEAISPSLTALPNELQLNATNTQPSRIPSRGGKNSANYYRETQQAT